MQKRMRSMLPVFACIALCIGFFGCVLAGCSDGENDSQGSWVIQYTDGEGTHRITVEDGMPFSLETIPQKEGYDFLGLFDAEFGGTQYVLSSGSSLSTYTEKRNLVLFPHWQAKKYTLLLDYGKAANAGVDAFDVYYDEEILGLPEDLYVEGGSFLGWYSALDTTETKFTNGMIMNRSVAACADENGRIHLHTAVDMIHYSVRFYSYDGNSLLEEKQVEHGMNILDAAPKALPDGSEILSWSTQANGNGYRYESRITSEASYYVFDYRYVLTLDYGYDEKTEKVFVDRGRSYRLPDIGREMYTFWGWYENGEKVEEYYTPKKSTTLTARWKPDFCDVYSGTIRTGTKKINRDNETRDTFTLSMDLDSMKESGFTKLSITVNFDIAEVDNCGQHFELYDNQQTSIYKDVIYHGGDTKNTSWQTHSFHCEISLSSIKSTIWTLHFWGDNVIFHDYNLGTITVTVTAM